MHPVSAVLIFFLPINVFLLSLLYCKMYTESFYKVTEIEHKLFCLGIFWFYDITILGLHVLRNIRFTIVQNYSCMQKRKKTFDIFLVLCA